MVLLGGAHRSGLAVRDGNVAGLGSDPLQPGAHRRETAEVEAPLVGDVRVGVEGYVGHRVAVAHEEGPFHQVPLHYAQGGVAEPPLGLERRAALLGHLEAVRDPVPRRGYIRLMAVLLEKHPPQHLGPTEAVVGDERGAIGEVEEDSVRLGEEAPILGFEHRNPTVRVDLLQEPRGARLAPIDVVLDALEGDAELREEQARLVAVAGGQIVVQSDHFFSFVGGLLPAPEPERARVLPSMLAGGYEWVQRYSSKIVERLSKNYRAWAKRLSIRRLIAT